MIFQSLLTLHLLFVAPAAGAPAPVPSASQAPLPPPPPPVDPDTIAKGPWRGVGWFGLETGLGGPLDGGSNFPASSRVAAFGWGMHIGFRAQPWLGVGLGGFDEASATMVGNQFWLHPEHAENDYLETLATLGIIGSVPVFGLLVFLSRRIFSVLTNLEGSITRKAFALALLALLINAFFVFHAPLPSHHLLQLC